MTDHAPALAPFAVSALSSIALASILDQSVDCVKLLSLDGRIEYMNGNGLCAMEIDDFCAISGQLWASLWPEEARPAILASLGTAEAGATARFRAACPTQKGDPRWWDVSVSAVTNDDGRHVGYLSVSRDVTETETAREALEIAASELKHRLANTYAMIGGLLMGLARGNAHHEAFADEMRDRLAALGRAQALFATKDAPCDVERLLPTLLDPFERPGCPIGISASSAASVDQGQADAVALAIGELAVNSAKHGALAKGGSIDVHSSGGGGIATIVWTERSNELVIAHHREGGQGLKLMDRIARARRGSIDIAWNDFGLIATLAFRTA